LYIVGLGFVSHDDGGFLVASYNY